MPHPWDLPQREATPESAVLSRRRWLKWAGLGGAALVAGGGFWWWNYGGSDEDVLASGRVEAPERGQIPDGLREARQRGAPADDEAGGELRRRVTNGAEGVAPRAVKSCNVRTPT